MEEMPIGGGSQQPKVRPKLLSVLACASRQIPGQWIGGLKKTLEVASAAIMGHSPAIGEIRRIADGQAASDAEAIAGDWAEVGEDLGQAFEAWTAQRSEDHTGAAAVNDAGDGL